MDGPDGVIGTLDMDFDSASFVINDGQHRCAAIAQAIKMNPALAEESISVLLFPYESRNRVQQMFSDLNRSVVKTSKSLDILYDKRDPMSFVTLEMADKVPVFKDQVDKDAVSLPVRSPKLFSLSALYDANQELLRERVEEEATQFELVAVAVDYWKGGRVGRLQPPGPAGDQGISQEALGPAAVGCRAQELARHP